VNPVKFNFVSQLQARCRSWCLVDEIQDMNFYYASLTVMKRSSPDVWLLTYWPMARGLIVFSVSQLWSHNKYGPILSRFEQDLKKRRALKPKI
jgi:hypothetical protein